MLKYHNILILSFLFSICKSSRAQTFHALNSPLGVVNHYLNTPTNDTVYCASETKGVFRSLDNGANWTGLGGNTIGNGSIRDLCFSSNKELTAVTAQAGIKYWNGTAWIAINNGLPVTGGILPAFQSIVSVAGGAYYAGAFSETTQAGGIYFYNGTVWNSIKANLPDSNIMAMAIHPLTGVLYAGIPNTGVYKYNGSTWTSVNSSLGNNYIHCLKFNSNGDLFAGTSGGLYKLSNGSSVWLNMSTGLPSKPVLRILIDPSNINRIYAGLGTNVFISGSLQGDVYATVNAGTNWTASFSGINTPRVKALTITANGTLIAGAQGNFISTDNGSTWSVANNGFTARAGTTRGFGSCIDKNETLYYGSDFGVYRSVDTGAHWTFFSQGINSPMVSLMSSDAQGNIFAGAYANENAAGGANTNKLFRLANGGTQWVATNLSPDDVYLDADYAPNGDMYIAHGYGANPPSPIPGSCIAVSHDHGATWTDLPVTDAGKAFSVAVNKRAHVFIGPETNGVHRSTDGGNSFLNNLGGITTGHWGVRISKRDEVFMWDNPSPSSSKYIYFSDSVSNGNVWINFTDPSFPDFRSPSDIKFDNNNNLYLSTTAPSGTWGLYKASPPYAASTVFTPVTSIGSFTGVRYMFWDSCGHLYLYTTGGGLLKSDAALNTPAPGYSCGNITLPLHLVSFSGHYESSTQKNQLAWNVSSSNNTAYYDIEKSVDGIAFASIGKVPVRTDAPDGAYSFSDWKPGPGINYYRLKIVDKDGAYQYSAIVSTRNNNNVIIRDHSGNNFNLQIYTEKKDRAIIYTYNETGSLLLKRSVMLEPGQNTISVDIKEKNMAGKTVLIRIMINGDLQTFREIL